MGGGDRLWAQISSLEAICLEDGGSGLEAFGAHLKVIVWKKEVDLQIDFSVSQTIFQPYF